MHITAGFKSHITAGEDDVAIDFPFYVNTFMGTHDIGSVGGGCTDYPNRPNLSNITCSETKVGFGVARVPETRTDYKKDAKGNIFQDEKGHYVTSTDEKYWPKHDLSWAWSNRVFNHDVEI